MPGEPILIVDDTPVNLKLTRILLEHEGYDVRTAEGAEKALELLEGFRPRLVLADIQMPGIDGLEMTRRIRQDPRHRDILVVALTALAMQGDEEKAIAAGCDGYITKPINPRALAERVRGYLNESPGQPLTTDPLASAGYDDLRARFIEEALQQVPLWLEELKGPFDAAAAQGIAHQWVGSGGLLGFIRISLLARDVETILRQNPLDISELRESLVALHQELQEPSVEAAQPSPAPVIESVTSGPVIVLADADGEIRAWGKALCESQNIQCRTESDGLAALAAIRSLQPLAVVLDVNLPGMSGYDVLANLRAEGSRVKVLLMGDDEHPHTLGADDFLRKPFNPLELVVRVQKWLEGAGLDVPPR
jgi:two-component system cell cycle response regulator DivK